MVVEEKPSKVRGPLLLLLAIPTRALHKLHPDSASGKHSCVCLCDASQQAGMGGEQPSLTLFKAILLCANVRAGAGCLRSGAHFEHSCAYVMP